MLASTAPAFPPQPSRLKDVTQDQLPAAAAGGTHRTQLVQAFPPSAGMPDLLCGVNVPHCAGGKEKLMQGLGFGVARPRRARRRHPRSHRDPPVVQPLHRAHVAKDHLAGIISRQLIHCTLPYELPRFPVQPPEPHCRVVLDTRRPRPISGIMRLSISLGFPLIPVDNRAQARPH